MALAVRAAQTSQDRAKRRSLLLVVTMLFGAAFLGIKAIEYTDKFGIIIVPGPALSLGRALSEGRRSSSTRCTSR